MVLDSIPPRCFQIIIFVILTGILKCLETSIDNANEAKLQKLADNNNQNAKKMLIMLEKKSKLYNSLCIFTVISEIFATFTAAVTLPELFTVSYPVALCISILIMLAALLIFGIYIPKRTADLYSDKILVNFLLIK